MPRQLHPSTDTDTHGKVIRTGDTICEVANPNKTYVVSGYMNETGFLRPYVVVEGEGRFIILNTTLFEIIDTPEVEL